MSAPSPSRRPIAGMLVLAGAMLFGLAGMARTDGPPTPAGYRTEMYRAPTPDSVPGGTRIDTAQLQALLAGPGGAVLVDVMAAEIAREPAPVWLVPETRMHLPGSTWLPNVGYGELAAETEAYFRRHLERLTGGDRNRALVFYCIADCWMSWNAVKRAAEWGYTKLYWYPGGTDDWRDAGLELVPACPLPLQPGSGPDC
ncbi:PQQ-dependent catabolism-associated CXXCW motif protein [Indioceanicola profundi]|uniref:PQQ-dependent catabolism-associated CXXCW motif protein n=1 Tax=Indioceanicola profundi TaxID=2220096 RepID=UPI001CEC6DFC|nr:PQQ-dependent catabolism-associated CXXCW motif protein [Indioceanicola profundi]